MIVMATWRDVQRIATSLPEVEQTGDERMWRVKAKLFAWERPLRPKEVALWGEGAPTDTPILAASVPDLGVKEALVADESGVYFTIPHFHGYRAVLAYLERIDKRELEELLTDAWACRAPKRLAKEFLTSRQAGTRAAGRNAR
jgi:hypothetical protein